MKTVILPLLILCLYSFSVSAQSPYSIRGTAIDTASKTKLINTSVSVLDSKDSTLVNFTWAKTDGSFAIDNLMAGKFILLVSYHGYADYVESFSLDDANKTRDFGQLRLTLKTKILEEVLINGTAAIKIKGDTTEFNARSFKIQPNDRVEDLLRQFPGIQVDQNGRITAQGRPVSKVLVDGEEFFGDDPTLVTRNIRADMVDKVQLFDKKSDQAAFTGIDDGKRTTTLNVTLREDSKNGYFGKVDGGEASDNYYQGQAMYNMFKAKRKFAAYGTIGNTNRTGLSAQDNSTYGGGGFGGVGDLESYNGSYNGEGLPSVKSGGFHFDSKWNSDKRSVNINYKIGSINLVGAKNILSQNNLPAGIINSETDQNSDNTNSRQKLDFTYQTTLTPSSTLRISADGTLSNSQTNTGYSLISARNNNSLLNSQNRSVTNEADQKIFNMSAFWTKKFKKAGRTTSLSLSQSFNENETKGYLYTINNFYNTGGTLDSSRITDQYKPTNAKSSVFNGNLTYSEPFSKTFALALNYGLNLTNNTTDNRSFNPSAPGKYNVLVDLYTNNIKRDFVNSQAGMVFNYKKNKTLFNFGARMSAVNNKQTDLKTGKEYNLHYINLTPQVNYGYSPSQQKSFFFNYVGMVTQPSIAQLQPFRENIDPLNITIGNPNLRSAFTHYISPGYRSSKALSGQVISFSVQSSFTKHPIISNNTTDAAGKNILQYQNLASKTSYYYYTDGLISRKFKKSGITMGINFGATAGKSYSIINSQLNTLRTNTYNAGITASKYMVKKYDFNISLGPVGYNLNKTTLNNRSNNGLSLRTSGQFNVYFPGKLQIGSTANYTYRQAGNAFGRDFSSLIWNSSISKKFFKKENLTFSLSGNDLLNQNVLFSKTSQSNYFSQSESTTIKRYMMLSLVWDFTKMSPVSPQK